MFHHGRIGHDGGGGPTRGLRHRDHAVSTPPSTQVSSIQTYLHYVSIIMEQTGCTRPQAIGALRRNYGDLVAAIMELTLM